MAIAYLAAIQLAREAGAIALAYNRGRCQTEFSMFGDEIHNLTILASNHTLDRVKQLIIAGGALHGGEGLRHEIASTIESLKQPIPQ